MRAFYRLTLAAALATAAVLPVTAASESRAYGIQIYSEGDPDPEAFHKLVSFPIADPSKVTVEREFTDTYIIGATGDEKGNYYMLESPDNLLPSSLVRYSLKTGKEETVATYDLNRDLAALLIVLDMTYDTSRDLIYVVGANVRDAEIIDDELEANFGLYSIDPATGEALLVGYQEVATIAAIASGESEMWGVDEEGNIWIIDSASGQLEDIVESTSIYPIGRQSMSYAYGEGKYYWASYTSDEQGYGASQLLSMRFNDYWEMEMEELGAVGEEVELIGLYIDCNPVDENAPAGVADLKVTPAAGGRNEATLTWKNPTLTYGGKELKGTLSVKISRDDAELAVVEGNPGEEMSWTDTTPEAGLHAYSVAVSCDGLEGAVVLAEGIFVGVDMAGAPASVAASRAGEGYAINVSWTAPEAGEHGGWFDNSNLSYNVTRYPDNKVIAESTTSLSLTDNDITVQAGYSYGVKVAGADGFGPEKISDRVLSGPALAVPYEMSLTEEDESRWSVVNADGDEYSWYVWRTGWGGTWDPFFRYYPEETLDPYEKADDWLVSPSIALKAGKKYTVAFDSRLLGSSWFFGNYSLWMGNGTLPTDLSRNLATYENEITEGDWMKHTVPFTVSEDGDFNFGIRVENLNPIQLYKFIVKEVADYDIAALTVSGPRSLSAGSETIYYVEVSNEGYNPIDMFTLSLVDGAGTLLAEKDIVMTLAPGEKRLAKIGLTPAAPGEIDLRAIATTRDDGNETNNMSEAYPVKVIPGGTWIDFTDGESASSRTPFYTAAKYSGAQTIYVASDEMKDYGAINAISYYLLSLYGKDFAEMDAEIWLGNTDMTEFPDVEPVDLSKLTKVYSGPLGIGAGEYRVTIGFDEPFAYTGSNIIVCTRQSNETRSNISYLNNYDSEGPWHSLIADSETAPIDFVSYMEMAHDLPCISFQMEKGDGVKGLFTFGRMPAVTVDRGARLLHVTGEYTLCRLYDASGALVGSYPAGEAITLPRASGILLVEVVTPAGTQITKIAL